MLRLVPPWAYAAVATVLLAMAFASGFKVASWKCDAAKAEEMAKAQRRFDKQLQQARQAATDYEQNRERGRAESRQRETRVREIYRDRQVPASCEPDPDALRVLDDALGKAGSATAKPGAAVPGAAAAS